MKWIGLIVLASGLSAYAQVDSVQGYCVRGGQSVSTNGLTSSNKFQNVIPHCSVTVYLTGTSNKATIYADGSSTPLANPFTADALTSLTPGRWLFYVADSVGVDVVGSGGDSPNTYPSPVPLCTDCKVGASGGGGGLAILTNGVPNANQALLNFLDPSAFNGLHFAFSNPTGGNETFGVTGTLNNAGITNPQTTVNGQTCTLGSTCTVTAPPTLSLQHLGTPVAVQTIYNGLDTPASLDTGYQAVKPVTDGAGGWAWETANTANGFSTGYTPPTTGQYVLLKPTSCTGYGVLGNARYWCANSDPISFNCSGNDCSSGSVDMGPCSPGSACGAGLHFGFTGAAAAAGLNPANVTSMYAVGVTSAGGLGGVAVSSPISCAATVPSSQTVAISPNVQFWPLQQVTNHFSLVPSIDSVICTLDYQATLSDSSGGMGASLVGLLAYYTGSPLPAPAASVNVLSPLVLSGGQFYMSFPYDYGIDTTNTDAYNITIAEMGEIGTTPQTFLPGMTVKMSVSHSNTITTPNVTVNGFGPFTIRKNGSALAASDLSTTFVNSMIFDGTYLQLSNPTSGGGAVSSLTTTGTSGASTLSAGVLNIPQYQGALTLTTTGSSGASTLSAGVLNIPQYSGGGGGSPGTPVGTPQVNKNGTDFIGTANEWVFEAGVNGAVCNDSTDDTSAFNTLLATVYAASGGTIKVFGTCLISGQITLPNDAAPSPKQPSIRITSSTGAATFDNFSFTFPGSLDLRFNASNGKILTLGTGLLEIDHITLKDGGSDCAAMIYDTATILHVHDVMFSGTASGTSACNDAIVLGGAASTVQNGGSPTDAFAGYGTFIKDNFFDKIRRTAWLRVYAQAVRYEGNTVSPTCGSTNAAAAVDVGIVGVGTSDGNVLLGNYFEATNYPYVVWIRSSNNQFFGDTFWDASGTTLLAFHFTNGSVNNTSFMSADATFPAAKLTDSQAPAGPNVVLSQAWQGGLGLAASQGRICTDGSGSGTAQTCNTSLSFVPSALAPTWIFYQTTTANSSTGLTINVNSTGAKSVVVPGASGYTTTLSTSPHSIPANVFIPMFYDGIEWIVIQNGVTGGGSGLSGMTSGQVAIAGSATTVTSSKALAGSGAGITTGPTSATAGDVMTATGTAGQIADSGTLLSALAPTASPTFTGTPDASGATQFKLPVGAGFASAANGEVGYDSTNKNWHLWKNGADSLLIPFPASPTSGDCYAPTSSGGVWSMVDAGGPCGISGGGVTSWSGDGALFNNSGSTGVVTGALANAAAHKFWGNNTGSSAAPGYQTVGPADMTAQATNTVVMNATGGSAAPTAVAMPTCTTGADLYNTSTHAWSCVSTGSGGFSPFPATQTTPLAANFTTTNFSGQTVADKTGRMVATIVGSTTTMPGLISNTSLPATPYTIDIAGSYSSPIQSSSAFLALTLRNSSSGKLVAFEMRLTQSTLIPQFVGEQWTNFTTFSATDFTVASVPVNMGYFALRITDDGTNRKFLYSNNGQDYFQLASEADTTFMTADTAAISFLNGTGSGQSINFSIYNYAVTGSVLPNVGP